MTEQTCPLGRKLCDELQQKSWNDYAAHWSRCILHGTVIGEFHHTNGTPCTHKPDDDERSGEERRTHLAAYRLESGMYYHPEIGGWFSDIRSGQDRRAAKPAGSYCVQCQRWLRNVTGPSNYMLCDHCNPLPEKQEPTDARVEEIRVQCLTPRRQAEWSDVEAAISAHDAQRARADAAEAEVARLRDAGNRLYSFMGGVLLLLHGSKHDLPDISDIPDVFRVERPKGGA